MKKIKAARDRMMDGKTEEKGLIVVHTGPGKGKSSSGFGMIMRCIAHEMPCAVVQFIKGNWATGERTFLTERFADECQGDLLRGQHRRRRQRRQRRRLG